jgi:hypothetical protein
MSWTSAFILSVLFRKKNVQLYLKNIKIMLQGEATFPLFRKSPKGHNKTRSKQALFRTGFWVSFYDECMCFFLLRLSEKSLICK